MGPSWKSLVLVWGLLAPRAWALPPAQLPIHVEESHAGSFYFLARTLPLEVPHTLLLVDAHSDASAIPGSDRIRDRLREGLHPVARRARLATWRGRGVIQASPTLESRCRLPAPRRGTSSFARVGLTTSTCTTACRRSR